MTVLFADMVDFTGLAERLGEEATFELVHRLTGLQNAAIEAEGGTVREFAGDGLMAIFGAPVALEDAPLHACRAALAIQQRMSSLREEMSSRDGVSPRLRIGIHTGPVVLGRMGEGDALSFTALGDTVNVAARLQQAAEPDSVLISAEIRAEVEGYADCSHAELRDLKGRVEAQQVYRLDAISTGVTRFDVSLQHGLTPMIGRATELRTLNDWLGRCATGKAMRINVLGDVGIGKSRLIHELRGTTADHNWRWFSGHCTADGARVPFQNFIRAIRHGFAIKEDGDRHDAERRLQRGLDMIGVDSAASVPYLLNLLGFEVDDTSFRRENAEVAGRRTRDILLETMHALARQSPIVLFVDDAHWLDRSTAQLLRRTVDEGADLPILVLCTYRRGIAANDDDDPAPDEVLEVPPLSGDEVRELAAARLGVAELPAELGRLVAEKADGNPLFAEEIIDYLCNHDRLSVADGAASYDGSDAAALPVSLQNLLMRRVDQLDGQAKEFLEAAAVAGRAFNLGPVATACSNDNKQETEMLLGTLTGQNLIEQLDGDDWRFNNALVRDGIYDSLLSRRRADLHGEIAVALESHFADRLNDVAEELARHFEAAGEPAKAVKYHALAGEKNLRVYALDEAEDRFRAIMDTVAGTPDCADDLFVADAALNMARVLYYQCDFRGIIAMIEAARPRFEALNDPSHTARMLCESGYAHVFSARQVKGKAMLEEALEIAEGCGDPGAIAHALLGLLWYHVTYDAPGPEKDAVLLPLGDRTLALAREIGNVWIQAKALLGLSMSRLFECRATEGRDYCRQLLSLGRDSGDPRPLTMGAAQLVFFDALAGDPDLAMEQGQQAIDQSLCPVDRALASGALLTGRVMANMDGLSQAEAERLLADIADLDKMMEDGDLRSAGNMPDSLRGLALVLAGRYDEGVKTILDGAARYDALGFPMATSLADYFLGQIYLQIAISGERPPASVMLRNTWFLIKTLPRAAALAQRYLESAMAGVTEQAPGFYADAEFNLGLLHAAKGRKDKARACFEHARPLAVEAGAEGIVTRIEEAMAAL
ncbi:MAG: AAA family ATPase [Alphaproteobacteria bacterium]|nr:AAA family ATPase [Alphaproteobacteria bacterium]